MPNSSQPPHLPTVVMVVAIVFIMFVVYHLLTRLFQ